MDPPLNTPSPLDGETLGVGQKVIRICRNNAPTVEQHFLITESDSLATFTDKVALAFGLHGTGVPTHLVIPRTKQHVCHLDDLWHQNIYVLVSAVESYADLAYGSALSDKDIRRLVSGPTLRFASELLKRHPTMPLPDASASSVAAAGLVRAHSTPQSGSVVSRETPPAIAAAPSPLHPAPAAAAAALSAPVPLSLSSSLSVTAGASPSFSRVLILNTGGTISMKPSAEGYVPDPFFVRQFLRRMPQFCDADFSMEGLSPTGFVTPVTEFGRRIYYELLEYDPLLDSSNMDQRHWAKIASDIQQFYHDFDGFVVMHGTDTMCYTASALSFMMENLSKTVVLTGSQIPMSAQRSDGASNLLGALMIAGHYVIPEVTLLFNNNLYRGNRCTKVSSSTFDGFDSPNFQPLVNLGVKIAVRWDAIFRQGAIETFRLRTAVDMNVGLLRIFPGIQLATIVANLQAPLRGVVLQTYGAGNIPERPEVLAALAEATRRGVIIVNCSQCVHGDVTAAYRAGKCLYDAGVIPGADMTPEAALTKLCWLIARDDLSLSEKRQQMQHSLRGEMKIVDVDNKFSFRDKEFLQSLLAGCNISASEEVSMMRSSLSATLMNYAAKLGDAAWLATLKRDGFDCTHGDYDDRTPLHLAAAENRLAGATALLTWGASVHARDRFGGTPLRDALLNRHWEVAALLVAAGADQITADPPQLAAALIKLCVDNDAEALQHWLKCKADPNAADWQGRTPLHAACLAGHDECVRVLLQAPGIDAAATDLLGMRPLDGATALGRHACAGLMRAHVAERQRQAAAGAEEARRREAAEELNQQDEQEPAP